MQCMLAKIPPCEISNKKTTIDLRGDADAKTQKHPIGYIPKCPSSEPRIVLKYYYVSFWPFILRLFLLVTHQAISPHPATF